MNPVIATARIARQRAPLTGLTSSVRLPVYVSLMLLVAAAMAVVVVGWTIPVRQAEPPPNAFIDYTTILPGQPRSALEVMQFSCNPNNGPLQSDYCTRAPVDGPFSLIGVTFADDIASRVHLAVRQDALVVGDLALLWGRPSIRIYGQSVNLHWPSRGVSAEGWAESGRFSYAIPVLRIAFT